MPDPLLLSKNSPRRGHRLDFSQGQGWDFGFDSFFLFDLDNVIGLSFEQRGVYFDEFHFESRVG